MVLDNNDVSIKKEKDYLNKVKEFLKEKIDEMSKSLNDTVSGVNDLKRFMWENLSDYTDDEREIALYEVDKKVDITNISIDTLEKYKRAIESPYFAKITFKEDGYPDIMDIYIGICTVHDHNEFYVFDWRSPISSMFYNYEIGKAKYDCPNGEISGEITSKMQFKIVNGDLIRCFNSNIQIDDEYLQEILANSSTDKMKNIVSTIQREQNLIIRNDKDKYLIVQGSAGSGKTSVALHRIAYLLYKEQNLSYNNVLILSPNDVFSDYISDVLPELGESNVMKTTFSDFATTYLKQRKKIESYADFLDRVYTSSKVDVDTINYKMSDGYKNDIDEYMGEFEKNVRFNSIKINGMEMPSHELYDLFITQYKKFPYNERIDLIISDICSKFRLSYNKKYSSIKSLLISNMSFQTDIYQIYNDFMEKHNIVANNNKKIINYEDITPLLYIYFKINGFPSHGEIKHVVIDEVQDYTLFQIELLSLIFKKSSFTLLGDVNQIINPYYSYRSLEQLSNVFKNSRYLELTKTYRSSEEIIDYSNRILDINNVCSIRRNVNIPVKVVDVEENVFVKTVGEDIIEMRKNSNVNRVAIITKNAVIARKLYKMLKNDDIQLLDKSTDTINSNTIIIPSYLSKGLEFDGVIAYNDYDFDYNDSEQKLFYVVCTRAQHQLSVYNEPKKLKLKNI